MYATSTAITQINTLFTDTGTVVTLVVAGVLAGALALVGVGFAWRHLTKRITGKKF